MSANPHTVTVTVDDEGLRDSVTFTCTAARTDPCHIYPDAAEWRDGDGQERYEHDDCWIAGWFEADCFDYVGDDSLNDSGLLGVPHIARTGPIEVRFFGEYVEWKFAAPVASHTPKEDKP